MKLLGRVTAIIAVPGTALLFLLLFAWPELGQPETAAVRWIDVLGAAAAFSTVTTWLLAIWHWGARYPPGPSKSSWGFAVVFGFVLGAAAYWTFGVNRTAPAAATDIT